MAWLPLHLRRQLHLSSYMYRIINETCPQHFTDKFTYISGGSRDGDNCNLYTKNPSHTRNSTIQEQKHGIFYPNHYEKVNLLKAFLLHIKMLLWRNCIMMNTIERTTALMNSILFDEFYLIVNKFRFPISHTFRLVLFKYRYRQEKKRYDLYSYTILLASTAYPSLHVSVIHHFQNCSAIA